MQKATTFENWYRTAIVIEQITKEAGMGEYLPSWLSAAIVTVLMSGMDVEATAKKMKLDNSKKQQLAQTLQNKELISMFEASLHKKPSLENNQEAQSLIPQKKYFDVPSYKSPYSTNPSVSAPSDLNNKKHSPTSLNTSIPTSEVMNFIMHQEGKPFLYKHRDPTKSAKNWIIGYGFNLTSRPDARQMLKNIGVSYKAIMSGKSGITQAQAKQLLKNDVDKIINNIPSVIHNFNKLPSEAKFVLIDMAYNMGLPRLSHFHDFLKSLGHGDYSTAIKEMRDSNWYNQVRNRAQSLIQKLTPLVN